MAQEHSNGVQHRRVTKSEACETLGVSLSTLDRRISEGQYEVERIQQGQVQRVFVLLPGDTARPRGGRAGTGYGAGGAAGACRRSGGPPGGTGEND